MYVHIHARTHLHTHTHIFILYKHTIFSRLGLKFVEMVGTLVELSEVKDESRFRELIAGLASRHIKYGVKSHHASIMGQVGIEEAYR